MTQDNVVALNQTDGDLVIVVDGKEVSINLSQVGLTINSNESLILETAEGQLAEMGQPTSDLNNLYKVHKAFDTGNVYIIPNSIAGLVFSE